MSDRNLKNFGLYIKRLKSFARVMKVSLIFSNDMSEEGLFIPTRRKIVIDANMTDSEIIAVTLHELGHFIEESFSPSSILMNRSYIKIEKNKELTRQEKRAVLECEKMAWSFGKTIAKLLKIPLGKWFYTMKKRCIRTYMS